VIRGREARAMPTLSHAAQSGRHPYADRGRDLYSTPAIAIEALLRVERFPYEIWEPAAGRGNIVRVLEARGHKVTSSDVASYDFPLDFVADFFTLTRAPPPAEVVVTNPPFRHAADFARHALDLVPRVCLLLRLAFLESTGRSDLLDGGSLAAVHVFKSRLPFMHRHEWAGPRASSAIAFAWFVWDRAHVGPATIDRI
jgi:hypothetical protein